jgi:hypothetical protein
MRSSIASDPPAEAGVARDRGETAGAEDDEEKIEQGRLPKMPAPQMGETGIKEPFEKRAGDIRSP